MLEAIDMMNERRMRNLPTEVTRVVEVVVERAVEVEVTGVVDSDVAATGVVVVVVVVWNGGRVIDVTRPLTVTG